MTKCLEDKDCTKLVLEIILEKENLILDEVKTQYSIKNLQGRSVRLDVYARGRVGEKYNVEIQRDDRGAGVSSMCKAIETLITQERDEAKEEGMKEAALRMLKEGRLTTEEISGYTGLSEDMLEELAEELKK